MPRIKERLERLIALRLTAEQHEKVVALAAKNGHSVSAEIRALIEAAA